MAYEESAYSREFFSVRPDDRRLLQDLQKKYSADYLPFIRAVVTAKSTPAHTRLFTDGQNIIRNIGSLLSGRLSFDVGKRLLSKTFDMMKAFDDGLKILTDWEKGEGASIPKIIKDLEAHTGKNFASLIKTHEEISSMAQSEIKPATTNPLTALREASPVAYQTGKNLLGATLQSALGPVSGLAKLGFDIGSSTYKGVSSMVKGKRQSRFSELLAPTGYEEPLKIPSTLGKATEAVYSPHGTIPSAEVGQKLTGRGLENATDPIYYFFDKVAYKASWTAAVLNMLKKATGEDSKSGGNNMGNFASGIAGGLLGKLIPALAATGGILVPAIAATALAFFSSRKIDDLYKKNPDVAKRVNLFQTGMSTSIPGLNIVDQLRHWKDPLFLQKRQADSYQTLGKDITGKVVPYLGQEFIKDQKNLAAQFASLNKNLLTNTLNFSEKLKFLASLMTTLLSPISALVPDWMKGKGAKASPAFSFKDQGTIQKGQEIQTDAVKAYNPMDETKKYFEDMSGHLEAISKGISKQVQNQMQQSPAPQTSDVSYGNKNPLLDGINGGRFDLSQE